MPSSPPKVFISAASGDLRSWRGIVKDALLNIGCHPVEQSNFPPDYRSVRDMLYDKISDCHALIHIVGCRYGAEPPPKDLPVGQLRRSYTQMEYDIGRELQRKRGDQRFRVYVFVCPADFPYDSPHAEDAAETETQRELQLAHRRAILEVEYLYYTPADIQALKDLVHTLREQTLHLQAKHQFRQRILLGLVGLLLLSLLGGVYTLYTKLPGNTADAVVNKLDADGVAARLRADINARFERDASQARLQAGNWQAIRNLEQQRDLALAKVADVITTIQQGLAGNPDPIFREAAALLEQGGAEAALSYLESHKIDLLAQVEQAHAQVQAAQEKLQQTLQPILLQAGLFKTRQQWDEALKLQQNVAENAPHWFKARVELGAMLLKLAHYPAAEIELNAAMSLAHIDDEKAIALNNLAQLLQVTNHLSEAERLIKQAIAIDEKNYGAEHPDVAIGLNNLAELLQATNRLSEAEPLMKRALAIDEKNYGPEHPDVATDLNNLAQLLLAAKRLGEAEPLIKRALTIDEKHYGDEHPNVARDLNNLAALLQLTNRLSEAEPLMKRALAIDEKNYGAQHPNVARDLNNLAQLLQDNNRLSEAESMMKQVLAIDENSFGAEHPEVAIDLNNHAKLLKALNRLSEAEPLQQRAVFILLTFTRNTGYAHPGLHKCVDNYRSLLQAMKQPAAKIDEKLQNLVATVGFNPTEWQALQPKLAGPG
ncbi:tetratricopeptide repeat protein [Methylomonas paludis]|uniref:Tetratricopeptide repeat protein n=1 Tax=Methylomonas paludis TaxID=1173101 RepID=A0A975RBA8_9GAMM|nr:tetratricopeptide repeat protein [Methylomonas paludis]QWF72169.1 tetratricopeptide repeat protein [Methylomonas paludis]